MTESRKHNSSLAVCAVIIATALGASSGLYIKTLPFSSMGLAGFRLCIPFFFFLPVMIKKGLAFGPPGTRMKICLASGLNTARLLFFVLAYKLTDIGNAIVLLYLWPLFALMLNGAAKKEKPTLREMGLIIMAILGVVLLNLQRGFSFSGKDVAGSLCMILSALLCSITMLMFKETLKTHKESEVVYFQNAVGALLFFPFVLMEAASAPLQDIGWGSLYGLSVGVLAWALFYNALKRLSIFQYGALSYVEVFFGVLFGVLFLQEEMNPMKAAGIVVILAASVLSRFFPDKIAD